ncbi:MULTISPECIES: DUF58 domain-containing protein [Thermomonospora]|uniref:Uncharacterized protein (DUF58 family) n=1 Tax=Thermomonospora cellulosilytica TaxID=1411118 RepID=A0A7W3RB55_9ACTN|nr:MULTISPECIES: DUF58 domain-containing protein [Thermomonospora]MBA9006511.1 uncharacterized protein (DUF58 family) [Thermomonospora cellulosilytica]
MNRTLGGLTTRGRSFVAAGVTAIVCAFVLGERDLLRAGMLVLALPLLSAVVVARTRYRLACARRLDPPRLPVGQEARVELRLENVSWLPSGLLMVEDRVPYALGGRARFVIDQIESHEARELGYRVRADVRGRYRVGPLTVRLTDPFGLVELVRSFSMTDRLTVTPRIVALPAGRLTGGWTGGGDSLARTVASAGEDDVAPREYRHGDDLRRVHWRSTARRGELMVRREEQHWQSSGTLFLDTRRRVHAGDGPASGFEQAVSVAASVGVHLTGAGMGLRLVTDAGAALPASASFHNALLDHLAVARPSSARSLTPGLAELGAGRESEGLVVAVLGALDPQEARTLAAVRRGTATYVAILVDPLGGAETRRTAGLLRTAGWRVVTVRSAAELAAAWTAADQAAEESVRGARGGGR